ncbi:MAG: YoaK family protein [Solirubrobacteraceae bacterium]
MQARTRQPAAGQNRPNSNECSESVDGQAQGRARVLLTALAFAAGCTDAVTYVALGHVFTANMTGNTVLLGIAIIAGSLTRIARSACALAGFCLGVALAARFIGPRRERLWPPRVTIALLGEALALATLAICAAVFGAAGGHLYWLLALSGVAMGVQSAAVQAVAVPGVATTYITGTLTGMIVGAVTAGRRDETQVERPTTQRLAAIIWITYLTAAIVGAAGSRAAGPQAIWIATAAALAVVAFARTHRHALATPGAE